MLIRIVIRVVNRVPGDPIRAMFLSQLSSGCRTEFRSQCLDPGFNPSGKPILVVIRVVIRVVLRISSSSTVQIVLLVVLLL